MLALEKRFQVAVLWFGGCDTYSVLPEADPMNFAPRVKIPILMLNGRYDFGEPLETCQEPMFREFATTDPDKRHVLYDGGHVPPILPVIKDTLDLAGSLLAAGKVARDSRVNSEYFAAILRIFKLRVRENVQPKTVCPNLSPRISSGLQ